MYIQINSPNTHPKPVARSVKKFFEVGLPFLLRDKLLEHLLATVEYTEERSWCGACDVCQGFPAVLHRLWCSLVPNQSTAWQ